MASQLLNEHSAPSYTSARDVVSSAREANVPFISAAFGIQGAIVTASTSFSIAWLLHWTRSRAGPGFNPRKLVVILIIVPVLGVLFYVFARRQWLKYLRHQAVDVAATFIGNAQGFDSAASASVVFIQEVELVSRGYRMYGFHCITNGSCGLTCLQKHSPTTGEPARGSDSDATMPPTPSSCLRMSILATGAVHSSAVHFTASDRFH